jgi:polyisoprenoid-binding protein YceI
MTNTRILLAVTTSLLAAATPLLAASPSLELKLQKNEIRFTAIGNPSLLKIKGHGSDFSGSVKAVVEGTGAVFDGTLKLKMTTLETGIETRDEHMRDKYLEVGKYPEATLTIKPIKIADFGTTSSFDRELSFEGKLQLHGIERPVTGKLKVTKAKDQLSVVPQFKLKLSDYKIDVPSFAGITVADDVDVEGQFELQGVQK